MPEYAGRLELKVRPYPLEILDHDPAPRDILEQEWWLAAIQEPSATFVRYPDADWPTTTLPAFDAAWAARQQGNDALLRFDLAVRVAFYAQSRNIGRPDVLAEIANEVGLDRARFERDFTSDAARPAVLEEARLGREQFRVRGTPTLMLPDGSRLRHPLATPRMHDRKITGVAPLPCHGDGCLDATRALLDRAVQAAARAPAN